MAYTLEVIVNAHAEGEWLVSSLTSAIKNVGSLDKSIINSSKITVVLDRPDSATTQVIQDLGAKVNPLFVDFGDLSLSRNFAVEKSASDFVCFLDGDDVWGLEWLAKAFKFIKESQLIDKRTFVLHPEINWHFGHGLASNLVFEHISTRSTEFQAATLATRNYWTALSLAPRDVYVRFPYKPVDATRKIGFEDWSFNIETFNAGIEHLVVPETVHFIRTKVSGSLKKKSQSANLVYATPVDLTIGKNKK